MARSFIRKIADLLGRRTSAASSNSAVVDQPPRPDSPRVAEILSALRQVVVQNGDGAISAADVGAEDHLLYLGHMDSMGAASFLAFIEDRYGVHIEDFELIDAFSTLLALARHIEQQQTGPT